MSVPSWPGPVVQRAILSSELQRLRQDNGATQEQVAAALDWSPSKLIRIEGGIVGVSTTDLHALLRHYGVPSDDPRVGKLTEVARDGRQRGWWGLYKKEFKQSYLDFIGYENGASTIRSSQPSVIPGLLQTEEYATAVTVEFVSSLAPPDIVVEVRMRRQEEILGRPNPPQLSFILDEAALHRRVGGQVDPNLMLRQLRHMIAMISKPNIKIEIIPFSKGAHFGLGVSLRYSSSPIPGLVTFCSWRMPGSGTSSWPIETRASRTIELLSRTYGNWPFLRRRPSRSSRKSLSR